MRIAPWHDPRQMLSKVSPWDDWLFAKSMSRLTARFIMAGHGAGRPRRYGGRYPRTATPDMVIEERVGDYDSSPTTIAVARYHRIADWTLAMGQALLTAGRTGLRRKPSPAVPSANVLVSSVEWFRSREGCTPREADFGLNGMPPIKVVDKVFGGYGGLILAANSLVGE